MANRKPQKPRTTLGATRISVGPDGIQSAEYIDDRIPTDKEDRELYFAEKFVEQYNTRIAPSSEAEIRGLKQNDTTDLDFDINCDFADYLELKAIKPLSEEFGREIVESGEIYVLKLAEWIYDDLIVKQAAKYGDLADRVFLLLYPEDWQFILNNSLQVCLASLCKHRGCGFLGVFTVMAGPAGLVIVNVISPGRDDLPRPEEFAESRYSNLKPGKSAYDVDIS